jgi:DtxR family Mn-dependent transcriptional regulator
MVALNIFLRAPLRGGTMLSSQAEECLEAIYRLGGHRDPVSLSFLAEHLGLSSASVNEMVRRLQDQELVNYEPYRGVCLQEAGLCQALALVRRHRLWERFLTDVLGLSWDVVHQEACRLEHAASDRVTEKLAELLDNPQSCPHGRPLPSSDCHAVPDQDAIPLCELPAGKKSTVAYISREDPELLRYLEMLRIRPNAKVVVEQVAPFDGPLTIRVNGAQEILGRNLASTIFVRAGER